MKDVTFYDLNFNKLYILPQKAEEKGYVSCVAEKQFNGLGSIEVLFYDDELTEIIKENRENLMVEWNGFWGIICAYRDEGTIYRITGESLNSLLRRAVVPSLPATVIGEANVETNLRFVIKNWIEWLSLGEIKGFKNKVSYPTDTYKQADEYVTEVLKLDNAGFEILADKPNKRFVFEILKSEEKNVLFSADNLNAYDFTEAYINRTIAYGGWYAERQSEGEEVWRYITLDNSLEGVFKKDVVLSAKTSTEAMQELKQKIADTEMEFKTRDIWYGVDYQLGDIVRVQNGRTAVKRRVTGVVMSQEKTYTENPIFSEVE